MLDLKKEGMKFYSDWWENEDFAKEKARKITVKIPLEFPTETLNKTWNEANGMGDLLSAAEYAQILWLHYKKTKEYLYGDYWSWTSSCSSDGDLVLMGNFDSDGADVYRRGPDYSYPDIGVVFSRQNLDIGNSELLEPRVLELERKIEILTEAFKKI